MEGHGDSVLTPRSASKIRGEKRSSVAVEEKDDPGRRRVKMRDLESVCRSEEVNTHHPKSLKNKESSDQFHFGEEEMSQVTEVPVSLDLDASQGDKTGKDSFPIAVRLAPTSLDLNTEVSTAKDLAFGDSKRCAENSNEPSFLGQQERLHDTHCVTSRGIGLDLNAEDVSSSANQEACYASRVHEHLKSRDASECGSSMSPLEEVDPKRRWEEMKQNGFLSSTYGRIPIPKHRVRKIKDYNMKKKMELARREQVDRFAKIAAPSGLLNGLNPGIINHVRNSKQVHSIIKALVRSEQLENSKLGSKQAAHLKDGTRDACKRKDLENMNDPRTHQEHAIPMDKSSHLTLDGKLGHCDPSRVERIHGKSCASHSNPVSGDDTLVLKLSSLTQASENTSSKSNEETANFSSTLKAASVASQWLALLHQDIEGRLTALRRSKKKVRAVITTELPFLISKEFSSDQENAPYVTENFINRSSNCAAMEMHRSRWSTLFFQMEKGLIEEEKQLESWLNQVKEMQLHCDEGLHHVHWNMNFGPKQLGTLESNLRSRKLDNSEGELAIMAAAASIYSTSNFMLSENVSCF